MKRLRGTLLAVPIVNVWLPNRSRYIPDWRDLNRSFLATSPSMAGRLGHVFMSEIVNAPISASICIRQRCTVTTCRRSGGHQRPYPGNRWRRRSARRCVALAAPAGCCVAQLPTSAYR